jgi:hypothetical protein
MHVLRDVAWRADGLTRLQQSFLEQIRSRRPDFQRLIDAS